MPKYTSEQRVIAFWNKVDRSGGEDACWEWLTSCTWGGYGHVQWKRLGMQLSHRIAWMLTYGSMPELNVLHKCDNRKCCNPKHLFLGTNQDNIDDKVRKGRAHGGTGERNCNAKLTDELVREIRQRYAAGGITQAQLGREIKVSQTVISKIILRQTWKHVT